MQRCRAWCSVPRARRLRARRKSAATFTYDATGNLLTTTYASGAAVANTYNNLGQLLKVNDTYKTSAGAAAHLTYSYAYNGGGLQKSVTDQANNTTNYSYDVLNRLTEAKTLPSGSATASADYQYTLDGDGNLLKQINSGTAITALTSSYAYNANNQTCWSYQGASTAACTAPPVGAHSYSYDADGDQTSNGNGLTMAYNALGQTTSITSGGTTTNYSYIGEGQSGMAFEGANPIDSTQAGLSEIGSGSSATYYTHAGGQLVDKRGSAGTFNYLFDGEANVVGMTDSTGKLVKQTSYDPYGNTVSNNGSVSSPFGYRSGYQTQSGMYHFGARFYGPGQASWTQQDPLNQASSLTQADRYVFTGADPINTSDPDGEGPPADAMTEQETARYYGCRGSKCDDPTFEHVFGAVLSYVKACGLGFAYGRAAATLGATAESVVTATESTVSKVNPYVAGAGCAIAAARKATGN